MFAYTIQNKKPAADAADDGFSVVAARGGLSGETELDVVLARHALLRVVHATAVGKLHVRTHLHPESILPVTDGSVVLIEGEIGDLVAATHEAIMEHERLVGLWVDAHEVPPLQLGNLGVLADTVGQMGGQHCVSPGCGEL